MVRLRAPKERCSDPFLSLDSQNARPPVVVWNIAPSQASVQPEAPVTGCFAATGSDRR
jgi:hypothetical protein